jgi:hypothetical protein
MSTTLTPAAAVMPTALSDRELKTIIALVYEKSGITLHEGKRALITARLQKRLAYWDGVTHQHSFALPRFIRDAVAAETRVVTDAEPLIVS